MAIRHNDVEKIYRQRWWIFGVLALAILIVVIDHTILNVALPTIQRDLGATVVQMQWMVDAYILAFATLLLTMGSLGDRFGRVLMLRSGMVLFGAASLIAVLSDSAGRLVAARVLMGIGASMIMPATMAIITHIFPEEERGRAIGAWGAMNGLGVVLGPLLGGFLIEHFGWNSIFFINIPIVLVALIAGWFMIPESRDPEAVGADPAGTVLSVLMVWLLVFGFIRSGDWGWRHPGVLMSRAGFLISAMLFLAIEKRAAYPMLDLGLFRHPRLSSGCIGIMVMTVVMFGLLFAFTMYMQFVKHYSAFQTGIRFLPLAFGYAAGSILSSRVGNRWGNRMVVAFGFLLLAGFSLIMAFWRIDTPFWQVGTCIAAASFSMGHIMAPSLNEVLGAASQRRAGTGSALGNVSFQIGGALGVAALGSLMSGVYSIHLTSSLAGRLNLADSAVAVSLESIGAAARLAPMLPTGIRDTFMLLARQSFMAGWQVMMLSAAAISMAGAVLVFYLMPSGQVGKEKSPSGGTGL